MTDPTNHKPPHVVKRRLGLGHLIDATGYSIAGFRRLLRESAARQELGLGVVGLVVLGFAGASAGQFIGFVVLFCALLAAEALNTAIEVLVNHLSPEWSQMAKDAKDLGSLAVGLLVVANIAYLGGVVLGLV
ncbi:diacylglycerol kinase [Roseinatronobacter thiooxidans]|uniref:diacylglycerol kinase n=1 Tax=Roseinatronobacter thiooxidans TaxID=121821 RepID=UPI0008F8FC70|nr:diacylglycerol kinase [Roseinatronobacter thiooxidans]